MIGVGPLNHFFAKRKAVYQITDVEEFVCTVNVRRLFYTALLMLAAELFRFASHYLGRGYTGSPLTLALTLATTGLILQRYDFLLARPHLVRAFCLSFWLLLLLGTVSRFAADIRFYQETGYCRPIQVLLFSMLLITIPFWEPQDMVAIFSAFIFLHSILLLAGHASVHYALFCTGVLLGALIIGYLVQKQSMSMLLRLKQETAIDSLTGVLNRKGGMEKIHTILELSRRYGGTVALYMIDIDLFKPYNDHYGHIAGDEALRKVAKAIAKVFARSTDVVCRYGGEEFVVCALAEGAVEPGGMAVAICHTVEALHVPAPDLKISEHLTVSVGFTTFSPNKGNRAVDIITLLDRADRALYRAKALGRNSVSQWMEDGTCVPVFHTHGVC